MAGVGVVVPPDPAAQANLVAVATRTTATAAQTSHHALVLADAGAQGKNVRDSNKAQSNLKKLRKAVTGAHNHGDLAGEQVAQAALDSKRVHLETVAVTGGPPAHALVAQADLVALDAAQARTAARNAAQARLVLAPHITTAQTSHQQAQQAQQPHDAALKAAQSTASNLESQKMSLQENGNDGITKLNKDLVNQTRDLGVARTNLAARQTKLPDLENEHRTAEVARARREQELTIANGNLAATVAREPSLKDQYLKAIQDMAAFSKMANAPQFNDAAKVKEALDKLDSDTQAAVQAFGQEIRKIASDAMAQCISPAIGGCPLKKDDDPPAPHPAVLAGKALDELYARKPGRRDLEKLLTLFQTRDVAMTVCKTIKAEISAQEITQEGAAKALKEAEKEKESAKRSWENAAKDITKVEEKINAKGRELMETKKLRDDQVGAVANSQAQIDALKIPDLQLAAKMAGDVTKARAAELEKLNKAEKSLSEAELAATTAADTAYRDTASIYQNLDGAHFVSRHGPATSDVALDQRIKTGMAPDGAFKPSQNSSRFASDEEVVMTRQQGIANVFHNAGLHAPPPHVAPPPGGPTTISDETRHHRTIGVGYQGVPPPHGQPPLQVTHGNKTGTGWATSNRDPLPGGAVRPPVAQTKSKTTLTWDACQLRWKVDQHTPHG
jgi:hypothetical protein